MKTNREILKELIDRADVLIERYVTASDPGFAAWRNKSIRFLLDCYGKDSFQAQSFLKMRFSISRVVLGMPASRWNDACVNGLKRARAIFADYLEEIEDDAVPAQKAIPNRNCKDVFVVHGHDGELREAVARMLEKVGLNAIVLSEQANGGKTIIEKVEKYGGVGAAICLFTADDRVLADEVKEVSRARQNVVFETGYFCGKLGRERLVVLADKGVEIPSDMQGVVYTDTDNWTLAVCKELKAMGFGIDLNRLA